MAIIETDGPERLIQVLLIGGFTFACVCSWSAYHSDKLRTEKQRQERTDEYDNCNIISVFDGKVSIDENQETNKSYKDLDYKLAMQDDEDLVVYVYSNDDLERDLYTKYIVSKIHVDEDENIYFDENDLSQEDYYEFIENRASTKYNGRQRTRNEEEN